MSKVKEILKKENVRILNQVKDWREAIKVSTDPLIEQGYITENYPKRIIQLTEEHGAYYIVAKNLALVHARPEDGVLKQQLAVTVIRKPVVFDNKEDEPVQLFVTLCATDSNSHLEMLQELAEIMMDESRVEKCVQMETPEALYEEITKRG
jgi:mannitol/fructose-specific phosphotransferase system IIA component (Ntr-type)